MRKRGTEELITYLLNYQPQDEQEANSVTRTVLFLNRSSNCFSRQNLKGHVTAGALVYHPSGKVLLNHHAFTDMWFQFGGHCDGNPNCLETALRELSEEAGIFDAKPCGGIFDVNVVSVPQNIKKQEPKHIHYDINYLIKVNNFNFQTSDESKEILWCTLDEAREKIAEDDIGMVRMLNKLELILKKEKETDDEKA